MVWCKSTLEGEGGVLPLVGGLKVLPDLPLRSGTTFPVGTESTPDFMVLGWVWLTRTCPPPPPPATF